MQRKPGAHLSVSLIMLAGLMAAPRAWAYLPSSVYILEDVAKKRAYLDLSTAVLDGYRVVDEQLIPVWTVLKTNQAMRIETRRTDSTEIELRQGRNIFRFVRGEPAAPPQRVRADPFMELLGSTEKDPGGQKGRALLARMKVNADVVSLTRHDGRPVWIIGAQPGQTDRPQLWIDKESFVPVRWIMAGEGGKRDVRLYGFSMPTTGPWFPERIEIWREDDKVDVYIYTDARLNVPLARHLFNPPSPAPSP